MPTLHPQAALETALLDLMRSSPAAGGLGYGALFSGRRFDGRPPPLARGRWYAAVHSDGARRSGAQGAQRTALDQTFGASVTVTVELVLPSDRWVEHRDHLETVMDEIIVLAHGDSYDNRVINAANVLAGRRRGDLDESGLPVGFVLGLAFEGLDGVVEAGDDWLGAEPDSGRACVYQRARFGGAVLLQSFLTLSG